LVLLTKAGVERRGSMLGDKVIWKSDALSAQTSEFLTALSDKMIFVVLWNVRISHD
jgi:hypothetical protein